MIEHEDLYKKLENMSKEDMENILDPIVLSVQGKVKIHNGIEVLANRIFALAVLELYEKWQEEIYNRN